MTLGVDWSSLFDALLWVERLGAADSGVLSFGQTPSGGIFVERNRICWAAAHGLERRLRELLRAQRTDDADFERVLREHSAESLVSLCSAPAFTAWSARHGRGFAPRVSFRPVDLLFDVVDKALPGERTRAANELVPLLGGGRKGASFHVDARDGSIVPLCALDGNSSVESLQKLGHWAALFPAATHELAALPSYAFATTADGDAAFVWWRGSRLYLVLCTDATSAASVVASLGYP